MTEATTKKKKQKKQKTNLYFAKVSPKLDLIESWYRNGADDKIVANNLNVGYSTFLKYKSDHEELRECCLVGKEEADLKVESALFKRAMGYEYDEVTFEYGEETKRVTKQVVPDTTAQIFWLKNRKPKEWRDKQDIELSGNAGVVINNDIPRKSSS